MKIIRRIGDSANVESTNPSAGIKCVNSLPARIPPPLFYDNRFPTFHQYLKFSADSDQSCMYYLFLLPRFVPRFDTSPFDVLYRTGKSSWSIQIQFPPASENATLPALDTSPDANITQNPVKLLYVPNNNMAHTNARRRSASPIPSLSAQQISP
jgi:hypothetical protein